jgi:hypothetical protein
MFRGLINDAKSAAGEVVLRQMARASVAVPFLVAIGFATAAVTIMLVQRFGSVAAYWMVAAGFTAIGIAAVIAVRVRERNQAMADKAAEAADTAGVASGAATQAMAQAPLALLGTLMSSTAGPASALALIRMLGRNLPLVLLLVVIGALFLTDDKPDPADAVDRPDTPRPNGASPPWDEAHERV